MKSTNFICFFLLLVFASCTKQPELYSIKYYIKTTPSAKYDKLATKFIYTDGIMGERSSRSIYLSNQELNLDTKNVNKLFLGISDLAENEALLGYNLYFTKSQVEAQGKVIPLASWSSNGESPAKTNTPFTIQKDEARSVVFEIDTDASIVPQADGTLKFIPVVKTTFE